MRSEEMIAVGIDVSNGKSMVAAMTEQGELLLPPKEYQHNEKDLSRLIEILYGASQEIRVVLEATGHYHYPILQKLIQAGLFVSVVNPFLMKKYMDGAIRKGKTDKKDAIKIATYCLEKWYRLIPYLKVEKQYDDLKFLSRQYNQTMSMKVKAKVQLANLLDLSMPRIKPVFKSNMAETTRNILYDFIEKYQHFDNIKKMKKEEFITEYCSWVKEKGYRNGANKAEYIYLLAQNSIPTRAADSCTCIALTQCLLLLKQSEIACNAILAQMSEIAKGLPEYHVVRAMAGVGNKLAPRLIAEIGDVRRFKSGKALNAYAGNDAPPYQSGQYEGTRRHISKRGSASLRKAGYEVMKALKTTKPEYDAVYLFMLKKESEGKPKNVAKMAALNKFIRIYYAKVMELFTA
jgi:transposase